MKAWNISQRLVLAVTLPVLVSICVVWGFISWNHYLEMSAQRKTDSQYASHSASKQLVDLRLNLHPDPNNTLSTYLKHIINQYPSLEAIAVVDQHGRLLSSYGAIEWLRQWRNLGEQPAAQQDYNMGELGNVLVEPLYITASGQRSESPQAYVLTHYLEGGHWIYKPNLLLTFLLIGGLLSYLTGRRLSQAFIQYHEVLISQVKALRHPQYYDNKTNDKQPALDKLTHAFTETAHHIKRLQNELQDDRNQIAAELEQNLKIIEEQNIELDIARKQALEASRIKSEFLANISQEIRTPMNGMMGFTNLLLKTPLTAEQRESIITMRQCITSLTKLLEDVLNFSKLEAEDVSLHDTKVSLHDCVETVLMDLGEQARARKIQVIPFIYQDVPQQVIADPIKLREVLSHLIKHSINFCDPGTIITRIMLESQHDNKVGIKVAIESSHPKLTNPDQKLFAAFQQGDTTQARPISGAGLTLAIAKKLIEAMGGTLGFDHGEGCSTIWFTLELEHSPLSAPAVQNSPFTNKHVLLVDACAASRRSLEHMLTAQKLSVESLTDWSELQRISLSHFDGVILSTDYHVKANQLEQCYEKLHARQANVLILTCDEQHIPEYLRSNITYLVKPFARQQLFDGLKKQLNIQDSEHENTSFMQDGFIKALAVDDNVANLRLIKSLLEQYHIQVTLAQSGFDAVNLAKQQVFDFILMDMHMPGMDGIQTTHMIRQSTFNIRTPIIALTAHVLPEDTENQVKQGLDDLIVKPINDEQLKTEKHKLIQKVLAEQASLDLTTSTPSMKKHQLIVWDECLERAGNKPELAKEMLSMLIESIPEARHKIQHAHQAKDTQDLLNHVHKLHGATCYCGVPELRKIAHDLETALKRSELEHLDSMVSQLVSQLAEVESEATEYLD